MNPPKLPKQAKPVSTPVQKELTVEVRKQSVDVRKRSSSKDLNPSAGQSLTMEKGRNSSYNVDENKQFPTLSKDISRGRLRPNDINNGSNINIRNMNSSQERQPGLTKKGDHVNSSSSIKTLEPINPPLNSYKDFANVFNVKGMMHGSKSRKHSKF